MLSDQELHNTVNNITNRQFYLTFKPSKYKNRRDEIIQELVTGINKQRIGTKYKPITAKCLAIKCNLNPFLKDTTELELVKKECEKVGNYKKLFWLIK